VFLIGKTVSHYKILSKLGEGGMGVVYSARDTRLDRLVALKFLPAGLETHDAAKKRFIQEAKTASSLEHPNICAVHDIGETEDGQMFIAMPHYEGETLDKRIARRPLEITEVINIAIQIADGLAKAQERGIVHRDIKPGNVLITKDGHVKILDFGLAKLAMQTRLTKTGTTVGTVAYMSPEQVRGDEVDARSDIFSLGAVLYELLTGQLPFRGDHEAAIIYGIVHNDPDPIQTHHSGISEQFQQVIERAMAKEPGARYASATELGQALRAISPQSTSVPLPKRRKWKPLAAISTGVVLVIAAVLIVNPFEVEIKRPEATAGENKLAVMYFENMTDPSDPRRHGEMLAELLITGLSEAGNLRIVSSQRLYDLLKQLGKEQEKKIDRTTATEVAKRAQARWMMQGRILQTEPSFVVTSQIVDMATGDVAASQRTQGEHGESLFSLVDRITEQTLDDLAVSGTAAGARPVSEMSTASEDALRFYLEGVEYSRKHFTQEARESFRESLAIDSTFAMAAFRLGIMEGSLDRRRLLRQAARHAHRASARERLYLRAAEAIANYDWPAHNAAFQAVLEEYPDDKFALERLASNTFVGLQERIEYGHRLVELDPTHAEAWSALAYAYMRQGRYRDALQAADKYLELEPNAPSPHNTRGNIYAWFGRLDDAIKSYTRAVEIKPDFGNYETVQRLGHMYANKGDFAQAEVQYRRALESSDGRIRRWGRDCLAHLLGHRGRYAEALEVLEAGERVERIEGVTDAAPIARWRLVRKTRILKNVGEPARGIATTEVVRKLDGINPQSFWEHIFAYECMIEMGMVERASEYLEPLRMRVDDLSSYDKLIYDVEIARLASARGNYHDALAAYDRLWERVALEAHATTHADFQVWFAEACFKSMRWADVIRVVERRLTGYPYRIRDARFHYFLGVAYQETGRNDEAIEQLEKLLTIWADADSGLEGLDDARHRLAILKH
jgi:serine/threonine protein kinase/Flp pilus assembly protein TadD